MHEGSSIYLPRLAEIVDIKPLTSREKLFTVRLKDGSNLNHAPGQFVELSMFGIGEAPISISSSPDRRDASFELCIRNAGSLTNALHSLEPGSTVGIRGPFGRGFPVDELTGHDLLFVAGGLGLAPLRSMINHAVENRSLFGTLTLLYGTRSPSDILFPEEIKTWETVEGFNTLTTVDLGDSSWAGHVGAITKLFGHITPDPVRTTALVVGPPAMLRFVLKAVLAKGIFESRIYLSLERRMKCGVGKCGHCQMDDVYVCQKGPVFPYTRIRKLPEAL